MILKIEIIFKTTNRT